MLYFKYTTLLLHTHTHTHTHILICSNCLDVFLRNYKMQYIAQTIMLKVHLKALSFYSIERNRSLLGVSLFSKFIFPLCLLINEQSKIQFWKDLRIFFLKRRNYHALKSTLTTNDKISHSSMWLANKLDRFKYSKGNFPTNKMV